MALDQEQKSRLHAAKLTSLARANFDVELDDSSGSETGAIGCGGTRVFSLVEDRPDLAVGHGLGALRRFGGSSLDVLCEVGAGLVARRLGAFSCEATVWAIDGVSVSTSDAEPAAEAPSPADEALAFISTIEGAGAAAVVEHGVVIAEVRGLEVARVVFDEFGPRLAVGVSTDDRIMNDVIHAERSPEDVLVEVVGSVAVHRERGADPHPLNRLSRDRWLRATLLESPELVGFDWLSGAQPPVPRQNLSESAPAVALGARGGNEAVLVASCGVNLELVPFAVDARMHLAPAADLVIVVPERDAVAFTRDMVDLVIGSVELVTVPNDWFGL